MLTLPFRIGDTLTLALTAFAQMPAARNEVGLPPLQNYAPKAVGESAG